MNIKAALAAYLALTAADLLGVVAVAAQQPDAGVAVVNVTVVDVEHGELLGHRTVLIEGDRIAWIGPAAKAQVPEGASSIDGRGRYLIPGLWDMHTHLLWSTDASEHFWTEMPEDEDRWVLWERYYGPTLKPLIAHGVTGIREMWGNLDVAHRLRRLAAAGERLAPRIVVAGHVLDGEPLPAPGAVAVSDPGEARAAVDSLVAAGSDFIKVYHHLRPDAYHAILRRAAGHAIPVAGHVPELVSAAEASDAGQQTMEHLIGVYQGCSREESELIALSRRTLEAAARGDDAGADSLESEWRARALSTQDDTTCQALLRRLALNGTWLVPTHVMHRVAYLGPTAFSADPRMRYVHPAWRDSWRSLPESRDDLDDRRLRYERRLAITRLAGAEGVGILAGTDTPNPFVFPGSGLHDELELLVAAGLSPSEALRAATLAPARLLGATDSLGTVAEGKVADLVLLEGNPLLDVRNTRRIAAVILGGRLLRRAALDALIADVERDFDTDP